MKKLFLVACVAAFCLTGCNNGKNDSAAQNTAQADSLNGIIAQKDSEINDLLGTLNEIEEGFQQISEAEHRVSLAKDGEGVNKKQKLKEDIQFIADRMKQMQKTIEGLQKQLEEKDAQLQTLREELDKKDIHIAALDETVNNLNTKTNRLTAESNQKTETINAQDKQIHTAWYVFGTKKELKEQSIIQDGKVMTGNFNKNYFTKVDIRNLSEIKLYSKSAKLLTIHPSSSYSLVRDANKQYTLHITNSQLFWSTSKYLVVLVK